MYNSLKIAVTEKAYEIFLDISVHLTGFNRNDLLATGMPETYYYTIMKDSDQDNVRAFFKEAKKIIDANYGNDETELNKQIAERLIPATKYFNLAKRIIMVWYTGIWSPTTINSEPLMISGESYKEGLIWQVAETHPAGAKQPGFGSWASKPFIRTII